MIIQQHYTLQDIRDIAARGFGEMYDIARADAKDTWSNLTPARRREIIAALGTMRDIAHNPAQYLSREKTYAHWLERADAYTMENKLPDRLYGFYIVKSPAAIVTDNVSAALLKPSRQKLFRKFSDAVQHYEYGITGDARQRVGASDHAENIVRQEQDLARRAKIARTPIYFRPIVAAYLFVRTM